jgi:hypothetical protein
VCRASAGVCDVAETCNGNVACPADGFRSSSTVCRAPAGPCDVDETCTGTAANCPVDRKYNAGTVCAAAEPFECLGESQCDGISDACPDQPGCAGAFVCCSGVCKKPTLCNDF